MNAFRDIAVLALGRTFGNFGVDAPTASKIADTVMSDHFLPMNDPRLDGRPADALAAVWSGKRLYLYRDGGEWRTKMMTLWEIDLSRRRLIAATHPDRASRAGDTDSSLENPSTISAIRREHEPDPVFISIDVESVLCAAFQRANDRRSGGADEGASR